MSERANGAAAAAVTSETRYRQLFENAPVGIIHVGLDGRTLTVNERAAASFGYASPDEFLERVPSMLELWVDLADRDRAAKIMLETGILRDFEVQMKRRDGSHITLSVSANPWRDPDGTVVGLQVSGIEVTDRVLAESRLAQAQAHASIAFWSWRLDTNEFVHTDGVVRVLGLDPSEHGRLDVSGIASLIHPDDRAMLAMHFTTMHRVPGERLEMEFRITPPDGSTRWLMARGSVDADGKQLSGSVQDITKQKQVQEKLTELNEMKTEFVGLVAHDLKMPLTVASGYAAFLEERWDAIDEHARRDYVERMRRALERLGGLVEDVAEVTKIESNAVSLASVPFDLGELVRAAVDEFGSVEPYPKCELLLADALPPALGDRDSVWRVLGNLLSNAVKFSPEGEPITIEVASADGLLEVSVTDRGAGISAADQAKLFQKFSRLAPADGGPRPPGTGLGLFICKALVEAWGGALSLESTPEHGSTFSFTVPVANDAAQAL